MTWNIKSIPPQKVGIDTYPKLMIFLIGNGGATKAENLNALQGVDLNIETEEVSNMQKLLILSAIKYHLKHFHADNQRKTFDDLNLLGATFEEIMIAPDIRLNMHDSTQNNFFSNMIFDALLTGKLVYNGNSSEERLSDIITNNGYFSSPEKAFLSTVILAEPKLILNIKQSGTDEVVFKNITEEHIEQAQHSIAQEPSIHNIITQKSFLQSIFEKEVTLNNLPDEIFRVVNGAEPQKIKNELLETFLKLLNKPENYSISDKLKIYVSEDTPLPENVNHKIMQYLDESSIINCMRAGFEESENNVKELGNIPVIVG